MKKIESSRNSLMFICMPHLLVKTDIHWEMKRQTNKEASAKKQQGATHSDSPGIETDNVGFPPSSPPQKKETEDTQDSSTAQADEKMHPLR